MDPLTILGVLFVLFLMGVIAFAKAASRADQQDEATAERLAMQNRDWLFPTWVEEER